MATRAGESGAAAPRLRRALIAIVVLVLWGFGTHGTHAGSGDEPHYLAIAHSLAFDGDLDLANNYGAREPLIAGGNLEPGLHVRAGRGGALRPVHDIGLPILSVPFVRVAAPLASFVAARAPESLMRAARLAPTTLYRHVVSLGMISLAAVLAGLLYDAMRALGGPSARARGAFAATLLVMASPPLVAYSTLFFTELTSAVLAFYAFTRLTFRPASTIPAWIATAAAIGLLLLVHVRNVGLVLGLTLVAVRVLRQRGTRRDAMAFGAALGGMLALRTLINLYLWDAWMTTPHAAAGEWGGWGAALRLSGLRLVALLIDQEYGLLIYAPIYVLAIVGLPLLEKRAPPVAGAFLIVAGCYLAFVLFPLTNAHGWSGQWCPAGRFLTPIVPLLALPVVLTLKAAPRATAVLVAAQIALSVIWWQNPKLLWNDGDGKAAFCTRVGNPVCGRLPTYATWVQ
jgi:hypothetical protein